MTAPTFFSPQWAGAVGDRLQAGPDEHALADKLSEYWDFYQLVRNNFAGSWALGARHLPAELGGGTGYLRVEWAGGKVTDSRVVRAGEPLDATFVLEGEYADWRNLYAGYDALRTVMYRKLVLERGPLLEFFKSIYFFVESLAMLASVATAFPETGRTA